LPAYNSNINLTDRQLIELSEEILKGGFNQVIISTLPISMNKLLDLIAEKIIVKVIFHGALSELSNEINENQFFNMIGLAQKGKIKKIGFVKSGLDFWCSELFNIPTSHLQLKPMNYVHHNKEKILSANNKIKIGIFGNKSFNKNNYNQIAAALLIDNVEIHTAIDTKFSEFGFQANIFIHPLLDHDEFVKLLSQMDVNLHLSFSEGMGGQVFTESLATGVPCLTSYNNEYLKHDKELLKLLTVEQYENPWQISKAIEQIISLDLSLLEKRLKDYSLIIEKEHENLLESFLSN
jgi:glycosyltransferase involved in cell wall biosynthesis